MMWQVLKDWAGLERSQWFEKERMAKLQTRRLKEIVDHAFGTVPLYQRLYAEAGLDASDITSPASILKFPVLTKRVLGSVPLEDRTAVQTQLESCTVTTTSGTTGKPFTMLRTRQEAAYFVALQLRRFRAYGAGPRDRICMATPGPRGMSPVLKTKGVFGTLLRLKIKELPMAEDLHQHLTLLSKWKPSIMYAPVSYMRALARFLDETGESVRLRVAVMGSEMLDISTRKLIENKTGAAVFEAYGLTDAGAVAWECPSRSGYHINTDSLIVEFLRDGKPVGSGEPGEVCVTNFWKRATPVIRYLVGDVATPLDTDCECGRGLALMKNIQGRAVDFIITKAGHHVSPYTIMYRLQSIPGIEQYKVVQHEDYSVEILVKVKRTDEVMKAIEDACLELFGDTPFHVKPEERIEYPPGPKQRPVQSLVHG